MTYLADHPEHAQQSDVHYQTLLYYDKDPLMRGGCPQEVEMIYAWHALNGTEPDWAAIGATDLGFAVGLAEVLGETAVSVSNLPVDLACWLVNLVGDPQGTAEATLAKIKAFPAYVKGVPAAFKEHINAIQAIEDPYEQGRALGKLLGEVLPTGVVASNVVSKAFSKVGKWAKAVKGVEKVTKRAEVVEKGLEAAKAGESAGKGVAGKTSKVPVGRRSNPISVVEGTNVSTIINGRKFTGHALDSMQGRGFIPMIVEDIIKHPTKVIPGKTSGTTVYIGEKLKVVLNNAGDVITVIPQ